jgi:hypothetical protein
MEPKGSLLCSQKVSFLDKFKKSGGVGEADISYSSNYWTTIN